jgi:gliding motility-associated protein GldL
MSLNDRIENFVAGTFFQKLMVKIYGFGASLVVIGTLFKIQHWPGSGFFLASGLITESIIFFFSAFEKEDEPSHLPQIINNNGDNSDWIPSVNGNQYSAGALVNGGGSVALAKFDEMLENADISPEMFLKLGEGLRKLGESTDGLVSLGDVSEASTKYVQTIRSADESLSKLVKTYETTITKVSIKSAFKYEGIANSLNVIEQEAKLYSQELQSINSTISSLHNVYKLQKKGADEYLKEITETAIESKKYREQVKEMNENLSQLNKVYGNMLSAMKTK